MPIIPTAALRPSDLPAPDAEWHEIFQFAWTFNGYEWAGGALACGQVANAARKSHQESQLLKLSLDELRACLFFEQRRFAHFGTAPAGPDLDYVRALLEAIRRALPASDGNPPSASPAS